VNGDCPYNSSTMAPRVNVIAVIVLLLNLTDAFVPPRPSLIVSSLKSTAATDYDEKIADCKVILNKAADTKSEDPGQVVAALESLEKLMRLKVKTEGESASQQVLSNLDGHWRLIFTTGTAKTQEKFGRKINYFPLKAVQSFDTQSMTISNGIYAGDLSLIKFFGNFDFDLKKKKLEFDFSLITLLGFLNIPLKQGEAAQLGAKSGLGSSSNVENAKRDKQAFFNWISADDTIATARGGGGGLALWQRTVDPAVKR
jgi:PAP_fibrillin